MEKLKLLLAPLLLAMTILTCDDDPATEPIPDPTSFESTVYASGLKFPIGMSVDHRGWIWVTESGTGANDGRVSLIATDGSVHPVVTGFPSVFAMGGGQGLMHPLFHENKLYILNWINGAIYIADVSSFQPGSAEIPLASLEQEDFATYVNSLNLVDPLNANPYNLIIGPDGYMYILDAGSNAVIRRNMSTGALSLFARIPDIAPGRNAVPTGIVYRDGKFLVTTLTGQPFVAGTAKIFEVDMSGNVTEHKSGFTTLTDIELTPNGTPLVLQYTEFNMGFQPNTGKVLNVDGVVLLDNLTLPTALVRSGDREYYVLSYGTGTVHKLVY